MRHSIRPQDAKSKPTTAAGLPKACKLIDTAGQAAPTAATNTLILFDAAPAWNYGGYAFLTSAGRISGVIIPEPGIYYIKGSFVGNAGAGSVLTFLSVNGAATDSEGMLAWANSEVNPLVGAPVFQTSVLTQLKQGDTVSLFQQQAAPTRTAAATGCWLHIQKEGGQY